MKRILSVMLSMLLCLSCVSVGMTAVFADDAEYTPVVSLTPEMYSPKTVYTDDDFNNRKTADSNTSLSEIADGKTPYEHPVVMTANGKSVTNYGLGYDNNGGIYAQASKNKSMMLLTENNVDADKIAVSFKFKFPTYYTGTYFLVSAATNGGTATGSLFHIQFSSSKSYLISYYCYASDTATATSKTTAKTISADYSDTSYSDWCNVNFELERRLKEGSTSEYEAYISKFYFTNGEGKKTIDVTPSMPKRVNADWWSGSVKESAITNASNVALRINGNYSTDGTKDSDLAIDDVMVYVPDDLRMKSATYDSATGKVKAVFTRGLDSDSLAGITLKEDGSVISAAAALDTTDTSNRTVIITPTDTSKTIDTANNLYTVTATDVLDCEGNAVPESSIDFGKRAVKAKNAAYYLTETNEAEETVDTPLTGKAEAGKTVTAKAEVINTTEENAAIMSIIAYYEGGVLKCANSGSSVTVNAGASGQISAALTMPDTLGENGQFRFFAFNENNMMPTMGSFDKENKENE